MHVHAEFSRIDILSHSYEQFLRAEHWHTKAVLIMSSTELDCHSARQSPLAAAAGASTAAARTTAATAAPSRLAASSPVQIRESAASRAESSTRTLLPVGGDEAELQLQQQTHQSESRDSSRRNSLHAQESKHNDQAQLQTQQISIHLQP